MTCQDARDRFSAWLERELESETATALAAHLEACGECRRELERFQRTLALLHGVEPARAPAGFVDRVVAAARPEPWARRLLRRLFVPLPVKLPLEAVAVALVAVTAVYVYQRTPDVQRAARLEAPKPEAPSAPPGAPVAPTPSPLAETPAPTRPAPPAEPAPRASGPRADVAIPAKPERAETREAKEGEVAAERVRPVGEGQASAQKAPEEMAKAASPLAAAPSAATPPVGAPQRSLAVRVAPAPDVAGRLAVRDRETARRAVGELLRRLGGAELPRARDAASPAEDLVEARLPAAAYPEFIRGLAEVGRWVADREPAELPPDLRIVLRLTD